MADHSTAIGIITERLQKALDSQEECNQRVSEAETHLANCQIVADLQAKEIDKLQISIAALRKDDDSEAIVF